MLWTAFVFGLLGSFHCIGMCGPIAFLLPLNRSNRSKRLFQILSYHIGRLFTYGLLGFVFGLLGKSLNLFGIQQQLSIIIGVSMIGVILIPSKTFNRYNFLKPLYLLVAKVKDLLGVFLKKKNSKTFFVLGILNGFLPCGLVYMAVFGAMASGGATFGALYLVLFGLGTIPLMTLAIYMGNFLKGKAKQTILKLIPVFVIIIGLLFVLRGMGLGIKYISPSKMVTEQHVDSKYNCH